MAIAERPVEASQSHNTKLLFGTDSGNYFRLNNVVELRVMFESENQPLVVKRPAALPVQLIDKEGRVTQPEEPLVAFNHEAHDALVIDGKYCLKFVTPPHRTSQGDSIARIQVSWSPGNGVLEVNGR